MNFSQRAGSAARDSAKKISTLSSSHSPKEVGSASASSEFLFIFLLLCWAHVPLGGVLAKLTKWLILIITTASRTRSCIWESACWCGGWGRGWSSSKRLRTTWRFIAIAWYPCPKTAPRACGSLYAPASWLTSWSRKRVEKSREKETGAQIKTEPARRNYSLCFPHLSPPFLLFQD